MANIVNLDRVSKGYGTAGPLLADVSLGLSDDDRIGVVGLNGAGKSTLLRLLAGLEEPDSGRVAQRRDLRVATLPQRLDLPGEITVRDVVLGTAWLDEGFAAEHEWAGDAGVRTVLDGLGMPGIGLDDPIGPKSGGERRRIALAALLIRHCDLLILDEPTNHLDIAGIGWLAEWINARLKSALVVVTHDRWFLDAVCTRIWEVADLAVRAYDGGFAAWTLARAERARREAVAEERRQNLLRKEIAWLRRGPPARTSKPRFRIEAANALIADVPPARDSVTLARLATARLGRQVVDLEDVTLYAGGPSGKLVLDDVTWRIGPGDRFALLGPNGAGKTTLLRAVIDAAQGRQTVQSGVVKVGQTVRVAYLSQELAELPGDLRLLEAVEQVAKRVTLGDRELSATQLAEVFGFTDRRVWTHVRDLSGGERRRLQLLRLLAAEPNVLILDEPTNDLDTDTLAALEDLLDGWPGTLIVASHDRYLVERVCDSVYKLEGGRLTHLPGGVDEYLASLDGGAQPAAAASPKPAREGPSAGDVRQAKKDLVRLERALGKLADKEEKLHAQMAEYATDYARIASLDTDLRALHAEKAALEEEWLTLAETVSE